MLWVVCMQTCVIAAAAQDVPSRLVLRRSANGELLRKSVLGRLFGLLAAILLSGPTQQPGAPGLPEQTHSCCPSRALLTVPDDC